MSFADFMEFVEHERGCPNSIEEFCTVRETICKGSFYRLCPEIRVCTPECSFSDKCPGYMHNMPCYYGEEDRRAKLQDSRGEKT